MPRKDGNKWKVDIRPNGHAGKRIIRRFNTKAEALNFKNHILAQTSAGREWNPTPKDNRLLSEVIELWWNHHGKTLAAGADQRRILDLFCKALGDPIARSITTEDIHNWRSERLESIKPSTLNTQMISVRGLFNLLRKQKLIDYENPAAPIRSIKVHENTKAFLSAGEIESLDAHPDRDVAIICEICLATGARWGEAMRLHYSEVHPDRITFNNTKTKRSRTVPIESALYDKIMVDRKAGQRLFRSCQAIVLDYSNPSDQRDAEHIHKPSAPYSETYLCQSFHYDGGNILTLQKLLGHANLDMTLKNAHLAPDYLKEAVNLNPEKIARERIGKDSDPTPATVSLAR